MNNKSYTITGSANAKVLGCHKDSVSDHTVLLFTSLNARSNNKVVPVSSSVSFSNVRISVTHIQSLLPL